MRGRALLVLACVVWGCGSGDNSSGSSSGGDGGGGDDGGAGGPWSCADSPPVPKPTAQTANITVKLVHAFGPDPFTQVSVRACPSPTDTVCGSALDNKTADANGVADFQGVALGPTGFAGYFEVVLPKLDAANLELAAPPVVKDDPGFTRRIYQGADVKQILSGTQTQWDSSKGVIIVQANDCTWATKGVGNAVASGVAFALDPPDGAVVYFDGNSALGGATSTDKNGMAMIANVAAGNAVTLVGTVSATGKRAGKVTVPVRAGSVTSVTFAPYGS